MLRLQQVVIASTLEQKMNDVRLAFRRCNGVTATTFSVRNTYTVLRGGDSNRRAD